MRSLLLHRLDKAFGHGVCHNATKVFARATSWSVVGSAAARGIGLVTTLIVARVLGPVVFGEFTAVQSTVGLFGAFAGAGLGFAATKVIASARHRDPRELKGIAISLLWIAGIIGGGVGLLMALLSPVIASTTLSAPELAPILAVSAVVLVVDSLSGVLIGIVSGFEDFRALSIVNAVTGLVGVPCAAIGALAAQLPGAVFGLLVGRCLTTIFLGVLVRNRFSEVGHAQGIFSIRLLQDIFQVAIPSFLGSVVTGPANWVCTTLIVAQPNGFAALGYFNVVNQLRTLALFLPDGAGRVAVPMLSAAFGKKDINSFSQHLRVILIWNAVLSVAVGLIVYAGSGVIFVALGKGFVPDRALAFVVVLTGIVVAVANVFGYVLLCSDKAWLDAMLRVGWAVVLVVAVAVNGRYEGAMGYGMSVLVASISLMVMQGVAAFWRLQKWKNGLSSPQHPKSSRHPSSPALEQ